MTTRRRFPAFTLLELVVVLVVLGVLAAVAVPTFDRVRQESRDRALAATADAFVSNVRAIAASDSGSVVSAATLSSALQELDLSSEGVSADLSEDGSAVSFLLGGRAVAVLLSDGAVSATAATSAGVALVSGEGFSVLPNGVTVVCPDAPLGSSAVLTVDAVPRTFVRRDRAGLLALAASGDDEGLASSCTSGVSDLSSLLHNRTTADPDISTWDVSAVTSMYRTFRNAREFDADISAWDVSNVTNMREMFTDARKFNSDISTWDVSNVTNMSDMFANARLFDQPIGLWDVSNVTTMRGMFYVPCCPRIGSSLKQDLSSWDVSNVTDMAFMFAGVRGTPASSIANIGAWDVSNVTSMSHMFYDSSFNGDITGWDVSRVASMQTMFGFNSNFRRDLSGWDFANVTDARHFLNFAYAKIGDANYRALLIALADRPEHTIVSVSTHPSGSLVTSSAPHRLVEGNLVTVSGSGSYDGQASVVAVLDDSRYVLSAPYVGDAAGVGRKDLKPGVTFSATSDRYELGGPSEAARTGIITTYGWTFLDAGGS